MNILLSINIVLYSVLYLRIFFHYEAVWMKEIFINKNMLGYVSMTLHFILFNSSQLWTEYFFAVERGNSSRFFYNLSKTDKQNSLVILIYYCQVVDCKLFFSLFFPLLQVCANTVQNSSWVFPPTSPTSIVQSVHLPSFLDLPVSSPNFLRGNWRTLKDTGHSRATEKVTFGGTIATRNPSFPVPMIPIWISLLVSIVSTIMTSAERLDNLNLQYLLRRIT